MYASLAQLSMMPRQEELQSIMVLADSYVWALDLQKLMVL